MAGFHISAPQWRTMREIFALLTKSPVDPEKQVRRIRFLEENVVLPVKAVLIAMIGYIFFISDWFDGVKEVGDVPLWYLKAAFYLYILVNATAGWVFFKVDRFSLSTVRWTLFAANVLDTLYLAEITIFTGGLNNFAYWIFLGLIVRNAVSMSDPPLQITLNLIVIGTYVYAGVMEKTIIEYQLERQFDLEEPIARLVTGLGGFQYIESFVIRICMMLLLLISCYGVQILLDRQRRSEEERQELLVRQEQLQAAGRLAAEIAHRIKNPLAIINNAVFVLQRQLKHEGDVAAANLEIIKDEVERSDRIVTELMGYAQLAEGRVESLDVAQEIDAAIAEVFPQGGGFGVEVRRTVAAGLPELKMQRQHLRECLVNLMLNAREALGGKGVVEVTASPGDNYNVIVTVADNGPGIPLDRRERVFEAYFTTKSSGSGLGLAIVKHNVEVYGGQVKVDSGLGSGARFTLTLPSRTMLRMPA